MSAIKRWYAQSTNPDALTGALYKPENFDPTKNGFSSVSFGGRFGRTARIEQLAFLGQVLVDLQALLAFVA